MPRYFARKIKDLQHRRTFSHDAVKFQVPEQLLFEHAHAPPLIVKLRRIVQRFLQVRAVNRLGQKICRAPPDRFQR